MDAELEQFKTSINLTEFAASRGYALDGRESSRNSVVMRHPNGDKIIVAKNESNANWMFFSVRDDQDNGTIIDFLQKRGGGSLGHVRQSLRDWLGTARPPLPIAAYVQDLLPITRDRGSVMVAWERARPCFALPYLAARGIGNTTLVLPRFSGCVRADARNNALFPHYDRQGVCGFEIKNKDFTGFAAGGAKGLWYSIAKPTDQWLVLVESAIDAYSFHILFGWENARYMSTGGALNPQQPELLRGAMEKLPEGAGVILGFDLDNGGENLADEVTHFAPAGRKLKRMVPDIGMGKDWNEMLQNRLAG
jgi:hypothetical protein